MSIIQEALRRQQQEHAQAPAPSAPSSAPVGQPPESQPPESQSPAPGAPQRARPWMILGLLAVVLLTALIILGRSALHRIKAANRGEALGAAPPAAESLAPPAPAAPDPLAQDPLPPPPAPPALPPVVALPAPVPVLPAPVPVLPAESVLPAADSAPWPVLKISGILSSANADEGAAHINGVLVAVGDEIEGVTLISVQANGVWLRRGQTTRFLKTGGLFY